MKPRERLREVRRGEPDVVELVTTDGDVGLLHAHGVNLEERIRTRERAIALLADALLDAPVASDDRRRDWALWDAPRSRRPADRSKKMPAPPPAERFSRRRLMRGTQSIARDANR